MKTNKLQFLLVLTGLLVTECSLNANPIRLSESGSLYPYVPNALSLEKNTQEEACFFDTDCDADTQKGAVPAAYTKALEDILKVEEKTITELKNCSQLLIMMFNK